MSKVLEIHPDNPQPRLIQQAVEILRGGGVVVYPTDSAYALGCCIGHKEALDRIRGIRLLDEKHYFTLVCRHLAEVSCYAEVDNVAFRLLKALTPGPFTFLLKATKEVPRRLQHPKRKTIGIRLPDQGVTQALLEALGEPLMSTTLQVGEDALPLAEPQDIVAILGHQVDLIIDSGYGGAELTTVIDLLGKMPELLRQGKGDTKGFI